MSKVLILKNDRVGDLFTSLTTISTLIRDSDSVKMYLSELNHHFNFFFEKAKVQKINYNMSFREKLQITYDIWKNKYNVKFHELITWNLTHMSQIIEVKSFLSEWCKGMQRGYSFINNDLEKVLRKLKNQI